MANRGTAPARSNLSVLLVDSDRGFLDQSCRLIAEDGHRAWGVEDLISAASFLADQRPDVLVVELALLEAGGADPLGDLRTAAPGAPTIVIGSGPPGPALQALRRVHEVYGYHDKGHGAEGFRLWVTAALQAADRLDVIRQTRQRLAEVLEAVPELHQIQSLDEVMDVILHNAQRLIGGARGFAAARASDPVGRPPIEGFEPASPSTDDYVVSAADSDVYPRGATVDRLRNVPEQPIRRAIEERGNVIDSRHGVLPLVLAEHVLGLAYLDQPRSSERDCELLRLFTSQAAAAIRNAALYELATIDSTTRVFRKAFTLERLRETIKLAWRKAFPVSVLMLDIDGFKELNDRHGHLAGDRVLRYLGSLLKSNVRDSDIVGRFGGDEFLVTLIDANHQGADIVADRLYGALTGARVGPWPANVPDVHMSMGMVTLDPGEVPPVELGIPDFEKVVERLMEEADLAMYRARRDARGIFSGTNLTWADFFES